MLETFARTFADAIVRAVTRDRWLPIDSAPRDGSEILLICASAYSPTANVGWWCDGWKGYCRPEDKWHGGVVTWFPTHWRPLPTIGNGRAADRLKARP